MLANFMIYSRPRYWIHTMVAPEWFHHALESDVRALLWEKDIEFDANSTGTDRNKKGWIINTALHNKRKKNLGIGLLDWPNHVRALRAKWILNYLDAATAPLKQVLISGWHAHA